MKFMMTKKVLCRWAMPIKVYMWTYVILLW